jgi:hypothetical protein
MGEGDMAHGEERYGNGGWSWVRGEHEDGEHGDGGGECGEGDIGKGKGNIGKGDMGMGEGEKGKGEWERGMGEWGWGMGDMGKGEGGYGNEGWSCVRGEHEDGEYRGEGSGLQAWLESQ